MRTVVAAAAALVLAAACGSGDEPTISAPPSTASTQAATTTTTSASAVPGPDPADCDVDSATPDGEARLELALEGPDDVGSGTPVAWTLRLTNAGDASVTLVFTSGQDGDVIVRRAGNVVWRWSQDRAFTEALRCQELPAAGVATYELEAQAIDVEPGTYEVEATLAARPAPAPVRRPVTVGA